MPRYRVHFTGGPAHGLVVAATTFSGGDTLWMPADSGSAPTKVDKAAAQPTCCRSVYRLRATYHVHGGEQPTIVHEFQFAGLETLERGNGSNRLAGVHENWLSRMVHRWWHTAPQSFWVPMDGAATKPARG